MQPVILITQFPRQENTEIYKRYQALAEETSRVHFRWQIGDVSLLQHGSGCCPGLNFIQKTTNKD